MDRPQRQDDQEHREAVGQSEDTILMPDHDLRITKNCKAYALYFYLRDDQHHRQRSTRIPENAGQARSAWMGELTIPLYRKTTRQLFEFGVLICRRP